MNLHILWLNGTNKGNTRILQQSSMISNDRSKKTLSLHDNSVNMWSAHPNKKYKSYVYNMAENTLTRVY